MNTDDELDDTNRNPSFKAKAGKETSPLYQAFDSAGLIGCIATGEELSTTYKQDRLAALLKIAHDCAALPTLDERSPDEILGYTDHPLPLEDNEPTQTDSPSAL